MSVILLNVLMYVEKFKAKMINDSYIDLVPGYEYDVKKVFTDGHIMIGDSPRHYDINCFAITLNGKRLSKSEIYRQYKLQVVKEKLGLN